MEDKESEKGFRALPSATVSAKTAAQLLARPPELKLFCRYARPRAFRLFERLSHFHDPWSPPIDFSAAICPRRMR